MGSATSCTALSGHLMMPMFAFAPSTALTRACRTRDLSAGPDAQICAEEPREARTPSAASWSSCSARPRRRGEGARRAVCTCTGFSSEMQYKYTPHPILLASGGGARERETTKLWLLRYSCTNVRIYSATADSVRDVTSCPLWCVLGLRFMLSEGSQPVCFLARRGGRHRSSGT
jgi:hypothetical protein